MSEQPIRVLLLDDEESLRKPLTDYLHNTHGFIVDATGDGNEALRLVEEAQGRYDVALVDEVLAEPPGGLDVLREIKARYPEIEVILFTGWRMQSGIEALRAGAYRYLAKPFDKDELAMTIRFAAEYGQTRRERKILTALQQVSTAISSALDLEEIFKRTCQAAVEIFGVEHSGLVEFENDEQGKVVAEFPDRGTLGRVIQVRGIPLEERLVYQQEVLNIPDVEAEHSLGSVRDTLLSFGIQSILIVPVVLQGKVVASFSLDAIGYKRTFYPNEIELCKSLANQVAVAIENARLYEETRQGREYLRSFYQATTEIIAQRDPNKVLEHIVETTCRTTGAWRAAVLLIETSGRPRAIATFGFDHRLDLAESVRPNGISFQVVRSGQPQFIPDTAAMADKVNPAMLEQGVKAAACLPLTLLGKSIGVLWIQFSDRRTFSETEQHALQLYANQSAIAYDNARRMRELEQLKNAADAMASQAEWKDVLQAIARSAKEVLEADYTLIWPYDADRKIFFPEDLVAEGIPDDLLEEFRQEEPYPGSTTGRVLQDGYVPVEDLDSTQADFVRETTRSFLKKLNAKSFQGIRLDIGDEHLGVLFVDYKHARGFGDEDRRILEHFANHAALTLRKARLHAQVRRSQATARAIAQASTLGNLDKTLEETVKGARAVLGCDIATLYTFDEDKQRFVRAVGVGYRDVKNMRPPEEIAPDSVLWKIIRLVGDKNYHLLENVPSELPKSHFVHAEEVRSALGIQLRFGERCVGVMFVNYCTPHRFAEDEIQDALQFANQAAVSIRNAQLHDEVRKRAEVMEGLYKAGKAITSTLALEETLDRIAEQALHVVGANCPQIGCFSHIALREGDKLRFVAAWPPKMLTPLQQQIDIDLNLNGEHQIGIAGRCVKKGKPQKVDNVHSPEEKDYIEAVKETQSQLSVPLKIGEHIIGVLSIEHPTPAAFGDEDVRNIELLAASAAMAIENARRYGETAQQLAARTALAWTGMLGSTWLHAVRGHARTIREEIQLLRSDVANKSKTDVVGKRLEKIERLANQILERPITPPLSAEEGVHSLPINDFLRERTRQLWVHEPYKSVSLKLNLGLDERATVRASPEWLRRALDILIDNAVEATAGLPERKIVIGSRQRGNDAEISITDNGHGIPSDVLERLFREPIKKPQGAKGQGIGLLLAQMIVQTYGGAISCRETGPTGTTMVISFPLEIA
jgi:GAF domain-containing protein